MVNKCSVFGCFTNHGGGHDEGTVFGLKRVKDLERKRQWFRFCNRNDIEMNGSVFICSKHFEEKFIKRNSKQPRLIKKLSPIPTIHPVGVYDEMPSCLPTVKKTRKPPRERIYQPDEMPQFQSAFQVSSFGDVDESLLDFLETDFQCSKNPDNVVYYKTVIDELSIPHIAECIRIDSDLHVKLFHKGSPIPLPKWFREGQDCKFKSKDMLPNFCTHIREQCEQWGDVLDEIQKIRYMKSPTYSASLIRYALMLRYSSLPAYKLMMKEFKLPSLSLLQKVVAGKLDTMKVAKTLKDKGNISEDIIVMFDEMYLQKCEEYSGGETYGADKDGQLFKGIVSFMIVGLKSNIPYVVKTVPEREIFGEWVKEEMLDCLKKLQESGFNVRGVVCDNHSTNVLAYKTLLKEFGQSPDDLFIILNGQKIYLFYDTVHLIKNVRNNLLNRKRFLFPEFHFNGFYDEVHVTGGEVSWGLFHRVHEADAKLDAHLKAAPKLTSKVLHPGNCKQSVPPALAIFDESTSAGIKYHFPDRDDASEFLKLFNTWWTISNSKQQFNSHHRLGNAAVANDNKPRFLREFANWLEEWENEKIPNCENFCLTAQTSDALRRTLRCHAALIEDLLSSGYDFVLTSRFQSDPLERRYGQYRQMSGGRFLVSLKDVVTSEKILKIKSLLREGFDINEEVKIEYDYENELNILEIDIQNIIGDASVISLSEKTKNVSNYVAGYVARQLGKFINGCCVKRLLNEDGVGDAYHDEISRGGLTVASQALQDYVASGFAILDVCEAIIHNSNIPSRKAGEYILSKFLSVDAYGFTCTGHEAEICSKAIRIIANCFFNNKRKCSTEQVTDDRVASFKKLKRTRSSV
jgi:hypothetical protein